MSRVIGETNYAALSDYSGNRVEFSNYPSRSVEIGYNLIIKLRTNTQFVFFSLGEFHPMWF